MTSPRIAVTVVSGFLGAGKTTLLNRMVRRAEGSRLAVIVNDFGELNIDAAIVSEVTDAVYSLQNGCICCTVQEDLLAQLTSLAQFQRVDVDLAGVSEWRDAAAAIETALLSERERTASPHPAGVAPAAGQPHLRLRRLPARLPLEQIRAAQPAARL